MPDTCVPPGLDHEVGFKVLHFTPLDSDGRKPLVLEILVVKLLEPNVTSSLYPSFTSQASNVDRTWRSDIFRNALRDARA